MPADPLPLPALLDEIQRAEPREAQRLYVHHGVRLARVARAAMEMRAGAVRLLAYHDRCQMVSTHGDACGDGIAAFDAEAGEP